MQSLIIFTVILIVSIVQCNSTQNTSIEKLANRKRNIQQRLDNHTLNVFETIPTNEEVIEDTFKCPEGCLCQFAHFLDLPISRWIGRMQQRQQLAINKNNQQQKPLEDSEQKSSEDMRIGNEVIYEEYESYVANPLMKQATCMVKETTRLDNLVNSLPLDLQALIILYTGVNINKTVKSSIFKSLNQLTTLEIRGTPQRTLRFVFDEPMRFLYHANFESIHLVGSDDFKKPKVTKHPQDTFDYKPSIYEYVEYDETVAVKNKLDFAVPEENPDILPYDIYIAEVKRARMPTFYGWDNLQVLRVDGCNLNELHWEMFDGLETLQHLSLERNEIKTIPPFAFYGAIHIKTLSLAHNHISNLHYRGLAGLLELEWLDISDNNLNNLSERSFPPFPMLKHIDFRMNPLHHIFPATFLVMNNTKTMKFGSIKTGLALWPNMPFESLKKLEELSLENVSISSLQQKVFKDLVSLKVLKLRGKVNTIEFDAFSDLRELQELDMSQCQLSEISMDAFLGCRKLKTLDMSYNNLTYIPPGLFDDQKFLQEIYLQGNQLRTLPTTFFQQPKLMVARLNDNPWECSCDMFNWRPKITNQERGPQIERCLSDYKSGRQIACHKVDNFKIERKYAPRCINYNGRSVFYVMRKDLKCTAQYVEHNRSAQIGSRVKDTRKPLWYKLIESQRNQLLSKKTNKNIMRQFNSPEKIERSLVDQRNNIEWMLNSYTDKKPKTKIENLQSDQDMLNTI